VDESSFRILVYPFLLIEGFLKAPDLRRTGWGHQFVIQKAVLYVFIENKNEEKLSWVP